MTETHPRKLPHAKQSNRQPRNKLRKRKKKQPKIYQRTMKNDLKKNSSTGQLNVSTSSIGSDGPRCLRTNARPNSQLFKGFIRYKNYLSHKDENLSFTSLFLASSSSSSSTSRYFACFENKCHCPTMKYEISQIKQKPIFWSAKSKYHLWTDTLTHIYSLWHYEHIKPAKYERK